MKQHKPKRAERVMPETAKCHGCKRDFISKYEKKQHICGGHDGNDSS